MHNFPTMITPYNPDGSLDLETAKKYVRFYYENGCDGVFAVCQSSEIAYLSVEERVLLNKTVYDYAKSLDKNFIVVSSGHVADSIEAQADELNKIAASGTDALIFITNRLDINNQGDDVFIKNAEKLISLLPPDIKLGLYECPMPYKRLVTEKILSWCVETGRFYFMKDTCCDIDIIKKRLEVLKDSNLKLLNANCQTLLESIRLGAKGYCGIMDNFHPALYSWLVNNSDHPDAEKVQGLLGSLGFTETGLPYPLSAKYHMCLNGIKTENLARNRKKEELTPYVMDSVKQMKTLTDFAQKLILKQLKY